MDSGLFSFASTTLILSLYNLQTRDITTPNVVVGMAIFCGGLAQLLAGMWEYPRGNTFGAAGELFLMCLHCCIRCNFPPFWNYFLISRILTFSALAFSSYGAFWLSYAAILVPSSGILSAYTSASELSSALGIYLITWFIVTFLLL